MLLQPSLGIETTTRNLKDDNDEESQIQNGGGHLSYYLDEANVGTEDEVFSHYVDEDNACVLVYVLCHDQCTSRQERGPWKKTKMKCFKH